MNGVGGRRTQLCVSVISAVMVAGFAWTTLPDVGPVDDSRPLTAADVSPDLRAFYVARDGQLLWSRDGRFTQDAETLLDLLAKARDDGLSPGDFLTADLLAAVTRGREGEDLAKADRLLSIAAADYVIALHGANSTEPIVPTDPGLISGWSSRAEVLSRLAAAESPAAGLTGAVAMNPFYRDLRERLQRTPGGSPEAERTRSSLLSNMDRLRTLPAELGDRYIVVNAASAVLQAYSDGRPDLTMKVVVGRPETPTPQMSGVVRYAVINPYWNIPEDLVRDRIAPLALRDGPETLHRKRMEVLSDWSNQAAVVAPETIDWNAVAAGDRGLRVRQRPGPTNMLGRVKYMLPNDLGIYLHDTPDRSLFLAEQRTFSAGCIRLEDADRLAMWLYGRDLTQLYPGTDERAVPLARPVPVYILYLTTWVREGDRLVTGSDPYGLDSRA